MKIIAVSGGVDSMVLSYIYKNENVVLAHVNYNLRHESKKEQKIVEQFAKKHNLILEKLILTGNEKPKENFQQWARKIRYEFFNNIYQKYNCNELLIAHHKDDFLETCIMQEFRNKNKLFYGIKEKVYIHGMNIYRPLLFKFWKNEIYDFALKNKIKFNDDHTNFESKYQRNKIRNNDLKFKSILEKEIMLNKYLLINKNNEYIVESINNEYSKWKLEKFNVWFLKKSNYQDDLIKTYLNNHINDLNLNQKIIDNLKAFIFSNHGGKSFKLNNSQSLHKKSNKLFIKIVK